MDCTNAAPWIDDVWGPGQPSDTQGLENCVTGNVELGIINDRACGLQFNYICEITPKGKC